MNKKFHIVKKVYSVLIFLVLIVLVGIGFSRASYLSQAHKRGVVRNSDEQAIKFTSNYLSLVAKDNGADSYTERIVTYKEDVSGELSCVIDVRNYIPGSANLVNDYTIEYKFSVNLEEARPGVTYKINSGEEGIIEQVADEYGKCSFSIDSQQLLGRREDKNSYEIFFDSQDLNNLKIKVTAEPINTAYTGNQKLAANIWPCTKSETKSFSCVGRFSDKSSQNSPESFDAYNYEIVLAHGRAKVTLKWNSDLYEIDSFFKSKLSSEDIIDDTTSAQLIFIMDQTKGNDSYIIPFYKKNKENCNKLTWEDMEKEIFIIPEELPPQS